MRSKPAASAQLLPSAHAIEREFRVMTALAAHGIPVPRTLLLVEDEALIGRAFFLMQHVEGRIFWEQSLPDLPTAERAAIYDEMNRVIAQLHASISTVRVFPISADRQTTSSGRSAAGANSIERRR